MKQYDNVLLVTGGAGFIGSAFLRMLVPKYPKWFFINLDALTYAGDLKKVVSIQDYDNYIFIRGNICDRELLESLFDKYSINIIVNFAAESHVDNSIKNASSFVETNIKGTYNLLDVSKTKWGYDGNSKSNTNFLFLQISTDEVYGSLRLGEKKWTEKSLISPNSPYSASKAAADVLVRSYFKTYGVPTIITRSSNNYGPHQNNEKFFPTLLRAIISNKEIPVYGEGKNIRDWIFVEDNVMAIEKVMNYGVVGEIYNIGGELELSNIELTKKVISILNSPTTVKFVADRLGHDFRYAVDSSKLKQLGWGVITEFTYGVKLTYDFYLNQVNVNN